jgi:predicted nucleotidyltransferase
MTKTEIVREIDNIKNQLIEKYRPEKIILFGSAAWGSGDEVNDLDFFIVKKDIPYYGSDRITELYRLMDTHTAVDYIVYKPEEVEKWLSLGDPFLKNIFAEGKLLYG